MPVVTVAPRVSVNKSFFIHRFSLSLKTKVIIIAEKHDVLSGFILTNCLLRPVRIAGSRPEVQAVMISRVIFLLKACQ